MRDVISGRFGVREEPEDARLRSEQQRQGLHQTGYVIAVRHVTS